MPDAGRLPDIVVSTPLSAYDELGTVRQRGPA
jgi:hypothetical protein